MSVLTAYDKFIQQALKYGFSLWGLPPTGQTIKYTDGDDGDYQKGYPKSGARYTDNGDGTVTDNATGLMWVQDPTTAPGAPFDAGMEWPAAITACEELTFAGHSDWRLPNVKELVSIVDYARSAPAIDATFFPNTASDFYWSSNTSPFFTNQKWYVFFANGVVSTELYDNTNYVRPVRLGVPKD